MGKILFLCVGMSVAVACEAFNESNKSCAERSAAQKVAEKVSMKEADAIKKYEIGEVCETKDSFRFLFQGIEEYHRPGFHWSVVVQKEDCKTEYRSGM